MEIFKTKEFRFISRFYQNIAIAEKKDGKIFIVNKYLDLIKKIEIKGDEDIDINGFGDGYFRIKGDNTEKLISMQGEIVCEYAEINYMKEGFFRVAKLINGKKKFAFINSKFKELTSFKYDFLNDFSENTASFRIENNWGIMNLCGKDIIKPSYSYIGKCKNGFIPVSLGDYRVVDIGNFKRKFYYGKFGFITKSGINVCPIIYDSVSDFDTNLIARVKLNGLFGLINEKGDEITKVQYDWIGENYDRFYYVVFENVGFVIDNTGYQFTEVEFTKDIEECGMYLDSDEENVYI